METIETWWDNAEIKTIEDVENKMLPIFLDNNSEIDSYLKKRFDILYKKLNNPEYNKDRDDIIEELNDIRNSHIKDEKLYKHAVHWAACATMQRNLSRNVCENLIFPMSQLENFILFCGVNKSDIENKRWSELKNLFIKNFEEMKNHPLNTYYQNLRKIWKSPIEAIHWLPRWQLALQNTLTWSYMLPWNDETMQWSKMWNTEYCLWRVNTILWIVALNEWIDYLDKHFKYVEVIKDWLEDDETQSVPVLNRDNVYLNDILNYEDPHQILLFTDDNDVSTQLDTNLIALKQLGMNTDIEHITKIYKWKMSDIAYEIYFLNYLNSNFHKLSSVEEKNKILNYVNALNEKYWWIPTLLKRLIAYANDLDNVDFENKKFEELKVMAKEYPCIKNTLAYQLELNNWDETLMNKFIHEKYWPQFSWEDIKKQYWL